MIKGQNDCFEVNTEWQGRKAEKRKTEMVKVNFSISEFRNSELGVWL